MIVCANVYLAYSFLWRLKVVFARRRGVEEESGGAEDTGREDALVKRTAVLGVLSVVSTLVNFAITVAGPLTSTVMLDTTINSICIILFYRFAEHYYNLIFVKCCQL